MSSSLPLVLAGPIVRRVQPKSCSIWIALSVPADVTVSIWNGTKMASASSSPLASSSPTPLHKFGDKLYIGVITLKLTSPTVLNPGTIYSYDVSFTGNFGNSSLSGEGLLSNESASSRIAGVSPEAPLHLALGYEENRLPSFVTPSATIDSLHLAHASCRKPHAPKYDAMAWLSDHIEDHYTDATQRLQQVFLTGDQIYADDVAAPLLPMLNQLGEDLLGTKQEQLPIDGDGFTASIENFPALRRSQLTRETANFTSTEGENHLLTFGEFMAMYLAVWSPRVWRTLASNDELFVAPPTNTKLQEVLSTLEDNCKNAANPLQAWRDHIQEDIDETRSHVNEFKKSIPKVAQALANISVYMIFDDHEITDDWNLSQNWRNKVYSKPLGKAIIRNGMMAYGICQGWGNDPEEFSKNGATNKKFLEETQKALGTSPDAAGPLPITPTNTLDEVIGLTESTPAKKVKWNYSVPGPRHLVCVMDTRTHRKFKGQGIGPPDLLGDTLKKQIPKGPFTDGKELLFIISPVPVFSPNIIDQVGAPLYEIMGDTKQKRTEAWLAIKQKLNIEEDKCKKPPVFDLGVEAADAESWAVNEVARENFLKRIALYDKAVILSGDVHYACSLRMDYWKGNSTTSIPIIQLTSSPSHNSFSSTAESLLRSNALLQLYEQGVNPELLGWNNSKPFDLPANTKIGPGRRARMNRSPALLPTRNWPTGTSIPANKRPDWRWRIELITDMRVDSDLPLDALKLPKLLSNELDPSASGSQIFDTYTKITARHQVAAATGEFLPLKRMVFTPNIGLINIINKNGLLVQHTLLSQSATNASKGAENTVHKTLLEPTQEQPPTLISRSN